MYLQLNVTCTYLTFQIQSLANINGDVEKVGHVGTLILFWDY